MRIRYLFLIVLIGLFGVRSMAFAQLVVQADSCRNCQNASTWTTVRTVTAESRHISSDYGPRAYNIYDWHNGVDYNFLAGDGELGWHVRSVQNGRVVKIDVNSSYKFLIIRGSNPSGGLDSLNLGYGHIFQSLGSALGDLSFRLMNAPFQNFYSIVHAHPSGDTIAIAQIPGGFVNFNGRNRPCSTTVVAGQPVAPLGNSGLGFTAHIHLYNFKDITASPSDHGKLTNPLQYVDHVEPAYTVTIPRIRTYSRRNKPFAVQTRCEMSNPGPQGGSGNQYYTNAVMNINWLELQIRNARYELDFHPIEGPRYRSCFNYGGYYFNDNPADSIYPADLKNDGAAGGMGSMDSTGVDPHAYSNRPYDDFCFADFYPRIHYLI